MHWRVELIFLLIGSALGVPEADAEGIPQDAYVWQRHWTPAVQRAVQEHGRDFRQLVVLAGEVSWRDKEPKLTEASVDYDVLRSSGCPVGLALRIGGYVGPFSGRGEPIETLLKWSAALRNAARTNGIDPVEFQLDFDCAESKLDGYARWVTSFRTKLAPLPIVITALPSWINRAQFKDLASAAGSYVLQVHSLERPKTAADTFSLCDPAKARRAVDVASQIGIGFRVALPTYGYCMAFGRSGQFIGISAEGPSPAWPADAQTRVARSNPAEIAELVQLWRTRPPPGLQGLIWYRLPVDQDQLNWAWPTLAAVRTGRPPMRHLQPEARRVETGLYDIAFVNDGESDQALPNLRARWKGRSHGALIAADAMVGYDVVREKEGSVRFEPWPSPEGSRVAPGVQRKVGWIRLQEDQEVQVEIIP